jgi:sugar/nucleoside kinase (ribokinase family)
VVVPQRTIERGTDVPGQVSLRRGGSAANVAAAFVRAGGRASLITSLGSDPLARMLAASLEGEGVRVHGVRHTGPSGRLAAIIDERGERAFVTQRGVADALGPAEVRATWLRGIDALHVPAYSLFADAIGEAAVRVADLAHERGAIVSVDLSSQGPLLVYGVRRTRARIARMAPDILFANRDEAAALLGRTGRRAWTGLLEDVPLAVVKDGAWGCRVMWRDEASGAARQLDVAAQRLTGLDSTGAGDAFAAGFLHAVILTGRPAQGSRELGLRRAALAGHRSAAVAMRRGRPEILR